MARPQVPLGCRLAAPGLAAPGVVRPGVIRPVLGARLPWAELRPLASPGLPRSTLLALLLDLQG